MYEDKTLVCKECGKEFVFTAGEQEFYAERGFQNEPSAARPAATLARTPLVAPVSTSPQSVQLAAARPRFLSSPSPTVRSTAASASPRCALSSNSCKRFDRKTSANAGVFLFWLYGSFFFHISY